MSLTEAEAGRIWQRMIEAEVRGYYYGELASRMAKRKQLIMGATLFLSSGAAATLAAKFTTWLPLLLMTLTAVLSAYSVSAGLDRRVLTLSKLSGQWLQLRSEYEHLWHYWYEEGAQETALALFRRDREASELGTAEAPYDESLVVKWYDRVSALRGLTTA